MSQKSFPSIGVGFLVTLSMMALSIVISIIALQFGINPMTSEAAMLISYVFIAGLPAVVFTMVKNRQEQRNIIRYNLPDWKIIILSLIAVIALIYAVIVPIHALFPIVEPWKTYFTEMYRMKGASIFLMLVFCAPVFEEIVFRGIILDGLLRRHNAITSIILSSVFFGIAHLNPWQFVSAFFFGLLVGWIYLHTQSLLTCIFIHMFVNLAGYLDKFAMREDPLAMEVDVTWQLSSAAVLVVCIYLLYLQLRKLPPLSDQVLEKSE